MNIFPKKSIGWWTIVFAVTLPVLLYLGMNLFSWLYEGVAAGDTIPQDVMQRPWAVITMLISFTSGVLAAVVGLIAVLRKKERAVLVILSTVVGILFTLYVIAEVIFSH